MWRLAAVRLVVVWGLIGNGAAGLTLWLLRSEAIHPFLSNLMFVVGTSAGAAFGYFAWLGSTVRERPTVHGSATFGEARKARAALGGARGLIVGRAPEHWLMRYDGPAHLLTLAPTRSGKGVGVIIPNLLTIDRSVICVDPKGENARITARARAGFGPVHVLDPFGASGEPTSAFNPLAALDPASLDIAEDAALIAEALVYDPPNQVGEAHWNEEAKALIAGIILHVVTTAPLEGRTLGAVRDLLTTAADDYGQLFGRIPPELADDSELLASARSGDFDAILQDAAAALRSRLPEGAG